MSVKEYGHNLRQAFNTLHGGQGLTGQDAAREPGESLEDYLARSREAALSDILARLEQLSPPVALAGVHSLLTRVLRIAMDTDEALAAQIRAYGCGDFQQSMAHSDRVGELVAASASLDRELILSLRQLEPAALSDLGIAAVLPSGESSGDDADYEDD